MSKNRHKYNATAVTVGEHKFPSKREANRFIALQWREKAGEIANLERQYKINLVGQNDNIRTPTGRKMHYKADFRYFDVALNAWVIEDAKGFATKDYKIKKAILAAMGIEIKEV